MRFAKAGTIIFAPQAKPDSKLQKLLRFLKAVTPPILWNGIIGVAGSETRRLPENKPGYKPGNKPANKPENKEEEGEKGPSWYDNSFDRAAHWKFHYSQSRYYFLWAVIADRITRIREDSVLEIGCGSGQLACLLRDTGVKNYNGFDFSPKRIAHAKKICSDFTFSNEDAFETDLFNSCDYSIVICTEFLEHVERDLDVLGKIRPGTRFYGTVPNFPYTSHVRHFSSRNEVLTRYRPCFTEIQVDSFVENERGKTYFLIEGLIK